MKFIARINGKYIVAELNAREGLPPHLVLLIFTRSYKLPVGARIIRDDAIFRVNVRYTVARFLVNDALVTDRGHYSCGREFTRGRVVEMRGLLSHPFRLSRNPLLLAFLAYDSRLYRGFSLEGNIHRFACHPGRLFADVSPARKLTSSRNPLHRTKRVARLTFLIRNELVNRVALRITHTYLAHDMIIVLLLIFPAQCSFGLDLTHNWNSCFQFRSDKL